MRRLAGWETAVSAVAAVAAYVFAPVKLFADVTSELVTVLGIVMAAFIPTMLLAATTLRAGRFSPARIVAFSQALDRQISLFGGLFLYALAACAVAIWGKGSGWSLPTLHVHASPIAFDVHLSSCFPAALSGLVVFLGLRSVALVSGVRSILRLSASMAIDEAGELEERRLEAERAELDRYASLPRITEPVDLGTPHKVR